MLASHQDPRDAHGGPDSLRQHWRSRLQHAVHGTAVVDRSHQARLARQQHSSERCSSHGSSTLLESNVPRQLRIVFGIDSLSLSLVLVLVCRCCQLQRTSSSSTYATTRLVTKASPLSRPQWSRATTRCKSYCSTITRFRQPAPQRMQLLFSR